MVSVGLLTLAHQISCSGGAPASSISCTCIFTSCLHNLKLKLHKCMLHTSKQPRRIASPCNFPIHLPQCGCMYAGNIATMMSNGASIVFCKKVTQTSVSYLSHCLASFSIACSSQDMADRKTHSPTRIPSPLHSKRPYGGR